MKYFSMLFLGIITLLLSSCGVVQVSTDYDKTVDFNAYKTYSFHEKGIEKLKVNDLDKKRLTNAIELEMSKKGLMKVNTGAELVINILTSSKEQIDIDNNYWYGSGYYGWSPYWGAPASRVTQYTAGTIIIDIIDDQRNILIWQGMGSGLNLSNISAKAERIPQAVAEILSKFPPAVKK